MNGRGIDPLDVALGEVPEEDRAEAARLVRHDAAFRAEVERLAPVVARLANQPSETWDPPEPPPLAVVAPGVVTVKPRRRRALLVLRAPIAAAASVVLLAAGVAAGVLLAGGGEEAGEDRTVLAALPGYGGRAELVAQPGGRVRLVARGLGPDERGYHELWLLPREGDPVAVGRFRVGADGRATATLRLPARPERFAFYDVSVEPDDGDPAHSGRSVLRADVRSG